MAKSKENSAKKPASKKAASKKSGTNPLVKYLRETRAELAKVTWPTRAEWLRLSGIVLAVTVAMALLLGATDYVGSQLMGLLIK